MKNRENFERGPLFWRSSYSMEQKTRLKLNFNVSENFRSVAFLIKDVGLFYLDAETRDVLKILIFWKSREKGENSGVLKGLDKPDVLVSREANLIFFHPHSSMAD